MLSDKEETVSAEAEEVKGYLSSKAFVPSLEMPDEAGSSSLIATALIANNRIEKTKCR